MHVSRIHDVLCMLTHTHTHTHAVWKERASLYAAYLSSAVAGLSNQQQAKLVPLAWRDVTLLVTVHDNALRSKECIGQVFTAHVSFRMSLWPHGHSCQHRCLVTIGFMHRVDVCACIAYMHVDVDDELRGKECVGQPVHVHAWSG